VNVLVNALDYSPDGAPVQITARQSSGVTMIKILDQSGGIAKAELPNIFKRFYRGRSSKKGGFGIGLSMAESIVRLHKGNIRAVNEENGLAMILTLPLLPCAENYQSRNLTTS
ncbi:MAG: sensor histidine kinase, partial [Lachnospiraceae bacterium]|nr:sensor histidine kinase [Lachnospiraceae bacterium]